MNNKNGKNPNTFFNYIRLLFIKFYFDKIIVKFTREKKTNSFFAKLAPNNYQYKSGTIRKFKYKEINLVVDISDYIGHLIYFGFRDEVNEKLMSLVKPNFTVLDVGTNIGSTLLQFANLTKEKGKVFGFEPDLINFNECIKNIVLNNFENIIVENIGLGNEKGSFNLVVDTETNRGGNRISLNNENNKPVSTIQVERLDDWIKNKNITQVDLIKIDVEGFEMNVLKGAKETLKTYKPVLFIELDDNNLKQVGSNAKELITFIENMNYSISNAENNEKVNANDDFINCHFDIICK